MDEDDLMHKVAAWDWLALVIMFGAVLMLAITDSGIASW